MSATYCPILIIDTMVIFRLEYTSPESLPSPLTGLLQQIDSKADMWSLGMILHKLLFFRLPYRYASEGDANGEPISADRENEKLDHLEREVLEYPGFVARISFLSQCIQTERIVGLNRVQGY